MVRSRLVRKSLITGTLWRSPCNAAPMPAKTRPIPPTAAIALNQGLEVIVSGVVVLGGVGALGGVAFGGVTCGGLVWLLAWSFWSRLFTGVARGRVCTWAFWGICRAWNVRGLWCFWHCWGSRAVSDDEILGCIQLTVGLRQSMRGQRADHVLLIRIQSVGRNVDSLDEAAIVQLIHSYPFGGNWTAHWRRLADVPL